MQDDRWWNAKSNKKIFWTIRERNKNFKDKRGNRRKNKKKFLLIFLVKQKKILRHVQLWCKYLNYVEAGVIIDGKILWIKQDGKKESRKKWTIRNNWKKIWWPFSNKRRLQYRLVAIWYD